MSPVSQDPQHAPEHLVRQLSAMTAPPLRPDPYRTPEQQQAGHLAQCRVWADLIWAEAFTAGAAYGTSISAMPQRFIIGIDDALVQRLDASVFGEPDE
jgi:hypothetical protein